MANMRTRWDGGKWLGVSAGLLFLTVISTAVAFASGFDWEPDEHTASYWRQEIPTRQWTMAISMIIPAASVTAAAVSMYTLPRRPIRIVGAALVAVLALAAFFASWGLGVDAVNSAKYWAQNV